MHHQQLIRVTQLKKKLQFKNIKNNITLKKIYRKNLNHGDQKSYTT